MDFVKAVIKAIISIMVYAMLLNKQAHLILIARNFWLKIFVVNVLIDIILDQTVSAKKLTHFVILIRDRQEYVLHVSPDLLYLMEAVLFQTMILLIKTVKLGKEKYAYNAHKEHSSVLMDSVR